MKYIDRAFRIRKTPRELTQLMIVARLPDLTSRASWTGVTPLSVPILISCASHRACGGNPSSKSAGCTRCVGLFSLCPRDVLLLGCEARGQGSNVWEVIGDNCVQSLAW